MACKPETSQRIQAAFALLLSLEAGTLKNPHSIAFVHRAWHFGISGERGGRLVGYTRKLPNGEGEGSWYRNCPAGSEFNFSIHSSDVG